MRDSVWFSTLSAGVTEALQSSDDLPRTADAVVVGAGIVGICTAYFLSEVGMCDVVVVDRSHALGQASGANAGGLWFAHYASELKRLQEFGRQSSLLFDVLADRFRFELRRNGLVELVDDVDCETVRTRIAAATEAGWQAEILTAAEVHEREPALSVDAGSGLYFAQDGNVNPVKLAAELIRYLRGKGVRFCFDYSVENLDRRVETPRGAVDCGYRVIASGAWTPLVTRVLGWEPPIRPIRGTLLALEGPAPTLHHTVMRGELYYWQLAEGHLAGGGTVEDVGFEYEVPDASVRRIREELDSLVPGARNRKTAMAWSGFRPYCEDALPVIGPVPEANDTFVAAGHFKKGIMLAPVSGKLIADLIAHGQSDLDWAAVRAERFAAVGVS